MAFMLPSPAPLAGQMKQMYDPAFVEHGKAGAGGDPYAREREANSYVRQAFMIGHRRRLNVVGLLVSLFLPWSLFLAVCAVIIFPMHYWVPGLSYVIVALCLALPTGLFLVKRCKAPHDGSREPDWLTFLYLTMLLAWILGVVYGEANFYSYTYKYESVQNMQTYTDVFTAGARGDQLIDAGRVTFGQGTALDISKSAGFKNGNTFCVAPIAQGNVVTSDYDFWAVGQNCCSGDAPDFHCEGFNNARSLSGLRLMDESQRPFYRLAVQQAEATYGIKANYPLFFHWVEDAAASMEAWRKAASRQYLIGLFGHLLLQAVLVACAALRFGKIGS